MIQIRLNPRIYAYLQNELPEVLEDAGAVEKTEEVLEDTNASEQTEQTQEDPEETKRKEDKSTASPETCTILLDENQEGLEALLGRLSYLDSDD